MSLGKKIQTYRKKAHLSQEQLAEQLGISRQAVTKWESGQSEPSTKNLAQLAKILNVSLDELAGMTAEDVKTDNKETIMNEDAKVRTSGKKLSFGRIYGGILIALFAVFIFSLLFGGQLIADLTITCINLLLLGGFGYLLILVIKVLKRKSEGL